MFFESEDFAVRLFLVSRFSWEAMHGSVKARNFSALAVRLCGEGEFCFSDGTHLRSRAGDVMYLPSGLAYEVDYSAGEVIAFHFWEDGSGRRAENFTPRDVAELTQLFSDACAAFEEGTPRARMLALSLFYRILAALCEREPAEGEISAAFRGAVSLLHAEWKNPELSFSELCVRAGISESAFRRHFHACYGKSPVRYLTELRLHEAQKQLIAGGKTVEAVALDCGFHDVKYFSRVVKRYFGCTPSELRLL
ncbi:MAG: AraC family transcriptional regulator [Clostridia bacterium]|nr:AraC family transcriptional regulator [Clostridia bacterium]